MFKRATTYLCLGLTSLSLASLEAHYESIKSSGVGGALIAYGQDSIAPSANPALAMWVGDRWDIGATVQDWSKKLKISNRPGIAPREQSGTFKAAQPLNGFPSLGYNKLLYDTVAVNISAYTRSCVDTRLGTQLTDFSGLSQVTGVPDGTKAELVYRVDTITTAMAYQVNDCHTIGIGLNFNMAHFKMNGLQNIGANGFSLAANKLSDQGTEFSFGFGVTVGWVGYIWDGLWAGASYTPQTFMNKFKDYKGLLADAHVDLPDTWKLGFAYEVTNKVKVLLDGEWHRYSHVRALANDFPNSSPIPFTETTFFGRADGPGFGWQDEYIIKTGLQFDLDPNTTFRLGYRHEWLPLRDQSTNTALNVFNLQTVSDYITAGITCALCEYEVSAFGEYGFARTSRTRYPQIAVTDFLRADIAMRSHNWATGVSIGKPF